MSTARIINFLGWINEKKPMFQCIDDQGRTLVIQSATHQDDYTVGSSYYVADMDNEHNTGTQRLIPLSPKNRWLLPQQLEKNFPYSLMKAYLLNDTFKKEIPGFRNDTVVSFSDTEIFLEKYGRARLYRGSVKNYHLSIKAGDEVTVGFDNQRWGSPVAYLWAKRNEDELGMKRQGMIIGEEEEEGKVMIIGTDPARWIGGNINGEHGGQYFFNYVEIINYMLKGNSGTGILIITEFTPHSDTMLFWNNIGANVSEPITFAKGVNAILNVDFASFKMIVISDTRDGSLSEQEARGSRHVEIASFVRSHHSLIVFEQSHVHLYFTSLGTLTTGPTTNTVIPTQKGIEIGFVASDGLCCWHESYNDFPPQYEILVKDNLGRNVVIFTNNP